MWIEVINKDLSALQANNTWDLVDLPLGKKPIGCKWVFKIKLNSDSSLDRYKARLVAKGYTRKYGIDYSETFSPMVKMTTVRCILAIAASKGWSIFQLDVNNAFLHGDLNEEVYMTLPEGLSSSSNKVCKLKKSLYRLKQASRQWFSRLVIKLIHQGFRQSKNDYTMFIRHKDGCVTIVEVYVDDIILTGDCAK